MADGFVEQLAEGWGGEEEAEVAFLVLAHGGDGAAGGELVDAGGELVEAVDGGEGVVDAGGEGADDDIGELLELEGDVLQGCALAADEEAAADAVDGGAGRGGWRRGRGRGCRR